MKTIILRAMDVFHLWLPPPQMFFLDKKLAGARVTQSLSESSHQGLNKGKVQSSQRPEHAPKPKGQHQEPWLEPQLRAQAFGGGLYNLDTCVTMLFLLRDHQFQSPLFCQKSNQKYIHKKKKSSLLSLCKLITTSHHSPKGLAPKSRSRELSM